MNVRTMVELIGIDALMFQEDVIGSLEKKKVGERDSDNVRNIKALIRCARRDPHPCAVF